MKRILTTALGLFGMCGAVACGGATGDPSDMNLADPGGETPSDPGGGTTSDDPCGLGSGFPGDALCILPPDPEEGIQLHIGPADYDDPEAVAPYLLAPGGEDVVCYHTKPSRGGFYYFDQKNRMRSGSHHMLIDVLPAEGRTEGPQAACDKLGAVATIPGSQTPTRDFPGRELGAADQGLGRYLPDGGMAAFQLHYVNTGETPVLREAWVNLYEKDSSTVTDLLQDLFLVADLKMDIPPSTTELVTTTFNPRLTEPVRVFEMTAHAHAHTERFSAWRAPRTGAEELVYESYDWSEPIVLTLTDTVQNPAPDPQTLSDGGASGMFYLQPGDRLKWECEVNNTLTTNIRFANEAYTAEMCLLAGSYVSETSNLLRAACANGACVRMNRGGL